ncbi:MAG: hypothetical protein IJD10_02235 [Clostridia bacterium]|nr:hypothetical protein [Clostridia bacterium]
MILNSKETTMAYRCPVCGKFIFGMVGLFTLTGDLIKLKCDCGGSEAKIAYTADRKLRITVPCLFCPDPHTYVISSDAFFDRELLALSCTYSNMDTCFIGETERVSQAAREADLDLTDLLEEAGFDGLEGFLLGRQSIGGEDNVEEDFRIDYAQIEEVVRFMLVELAEEGDIHCGCQEGDTARYDFEFKGDAVRIFCHTCGHEVLVPMSSTLAANAFLHADELILKKPGV